MPSGMHGDSANPSSVGMTWLWLFFNRIKNIRGYGEETMSLLGIINAFELDVLRTITQSAPLQQAPSYSTSSFIGLEAASDLNK